MTRTATIEDFVGQYLNATIVGIENAYNNILGAGTSAVQWAGSTLGDTDLHKTGYFGTGDWVCDPHPTSKYWLTLHRLTATTLKD